MLLLTTEKTY